jgi:MoaA/NifB/PqqE/SkfB family radical SAM enzyme
MTAGISPSADSVRFVQIEPTTRCNYICGFCTGRHMDQSDISVDTFAGILAAFPAIRHIELQGEGEPLLHKDFFTMAALARRRGIQVSLITNGSMFTPQVVEGILENGIGAIRVSIESSDPAAFQNIRGGKLDKVCEGIARLIAARDGSGRRAPTVGFMITVLRDTVDALSGIVELYDRLGMDGGIGIQPLNQMSPYRQVYDREMSQQFIDRDAARRLQTHVAASPRIAELARDGDTAAHFYNELGREFPASHGCPWVKGGLYVNRHGDVTTCCMVKDTDRFAVGKIGETSDRQILDARSRIDDALSQGQVPAQCTGCAYILPPPARPAAETAKTR